MEEKRIPRLYLNNVRMIPAFKNFTGEQRKFNNRGNRNFAIEIEDVELAKELKKDGWNVKFDTKERDDGTKYFPHLTVKIGYHGGDNKALDPRVQMRQGENRVFLEEDSIDILDSLEVINVKDIEINPRVWYDDDGNFGGITAWLRAMVVEVARDMFSD